MTNRPLFTYQTRLTLSEEQTAALSAYADLYRRAERSLFAAIAAGGNPARLKPEFMRRFGITARQFNAVAINLKGKIASIKERRPGLITEADARIAKARKVIAKLARAAPGSNKLHQKKRRLANLESRLASMKSDHVAGTVRLCFGSRRLFRAQFDLVANGYENMDAWRDDWQSARASEFFVIGSKDETGGCQGCVATLDAPGAISLRLRLPDALSVYGKYLEVKDLHFAYGHEALHAAWQTGVAIGYRFLRDENGWRVFVSTEAQAPKVVSNRHLGAMGLDINADHLAVSELDRFGNRIGSQRVPCVTYGKTTDQRRAVIGDAVKEVVQGAVAAGKPIVIEQLDFKKKKAELKTADPRQARMISAFVFSKTKAMIQAAAFRAGVEVIEVNPVYTSVIGAVNHAQQQGISVHQGAATAIARRGLGLSERPTVREATVPVRNGGHVTFDLPARNRSKHVWSHWSKVRTSLKAAHVAHVRSGCSKKPPAPLSPEMRALSATWTLPAKSRHANRSDSCSPNVIDTSLDVPY